MIREYVSLRHCEEGIFTSDDRIPYASRIYDEEEVVNLVDSALEFWLTSPLLGEHVSVR